MNILVHTDQYQSTKPDQIGTQRTKKKRKKQNLPSSIFFLTTLMMTENSERASQSLSQERGRIPRVVRKGPALWAQYPHLLA
jgi:hypothetical protein